MPEMSVVHFTESDVIAASLVLYNANDNIGHNMTMMSGNQKIFYNGNASAYDNRIANYFAPRDDGNYYFYTNGTVNAYTLDSLTIDDNNGTPVPADGVYYYLGNGNFQRKQ